MEPRAEPRLLASDQEAIERAARALRRGTGFVIVVCAPGLVTAARACLEARAGVLRPTVRLGTGEEMLAALVEVAEAGEGGAIYSLAVSGDARPAMVALNLHREKLLRGAPVVLWLDDAAAIQALREIAPDAYAFRTAVIVVEGDGGLLPRRTTDEPDEVVQWRKRFKRAKTPLDRARAGGNLAEALRRAGKLAEAERIAQAALDGLRVAKNDEELDARVSLLGMLAVIFHTMGFVGRARGTLEQALVEAEPLPIAKGAPRRTLFLASMPGPFFYDPEAAKEALDIARRWGVEPAILAWVLHAVAVVSSNLGDLRKARDALNEYQRLFPILNSYTKAAGRHALAKVALRAGDFPAAEGLFRGTADLSVASGADTAYTDHRALEYLFLRGELTAAERLLQSLEITEIGEKWSRLARCKLQRMRGEVEDAFLLVRDAIQYAKSHSKDELLLSGHQELANLTMAAHGAARLPPAELDRAMADLQAGERDSLALTGPEPPPWYPITFRSLRASIRALTPTCLSEAAVLAREAFELARATCPDLVPLCGRQLADHLLSSKQTDQAIAILHVVENEAVQRGLLEELAHIRAVQVLALVQQGSSDEALDERLRALRAALESTDSPRITAETLLTLARHLPPTCTRPDVLALAEEAQVAFFEMPMPAEEARAIEVAGDALLARGHPEEARRRYAAAKARLERFGLALRIPLLERKLAGMPVE